MCKVMGCKVEFESEYILDVNGKDVEIPVWVQARINTYYPAKISGPPESCYEAEGGDIEEMRVIAFGYDITDKLDDEDIAAFEDEVYHEGRKEMEENKC